VLLGLVRGSGIRRGNRAAIEGARVRLGGFDVPVLVGDLDDSHCDVGVVISSNACVVAWFLLGLLLWPSVDLFMIRRKMSGLYTRSVECCGDIAFPVVHVWTLRRGRVSAERRLNVSPSGIPQCDDNMAACVVWSPQHGTVALMLRGRGDADMRTKIYGAVR
jgi:hypothetical protein